MWLDDCGARQLCLLLGPKVGVIFYVLDPGVRKGGKRLTTLIWVGVASRYTFVSIRLAPG